MDHFFVGYNWPQPPELLRVVKRAALGLGLGVVGLSGALAVGHVPLEGGVFEFGHVKTVTGTIVTSPVPMLRPDTGGPIWPLLVAQGKHGAADAVRGLDGRRVALRATRIARGDQTMLEMAEAPAPAPAATPADSILPALSAHGELVTLRGEIVDSKCYLGVMVPGSGATHRDCASLCLRGGIPPALLVRDGNGESSLVLLVGPEAELRERASAWAGQYVELTGTIGRQGGWTAVASRPGEWRRLER